MRYFFDLLYYRMFDFYTLIKNGKPEGGSSCFLIGGLQLFNLISLVFLYHAIRDSPITISKLAIIVLYGCLFFINYFRYVYSDKVHVRTKDEWEQMTAEKQKLWTRALIFYVVASFLILFGLVAFFVMKYHAN